MQTTEINGYTIDKFNQYGLKEGKAQGFFACPAQYKDDDGEKSRCIDCKMCSFCNRSDIVVFDKD